MQTLFWRGLRVLSILALAGCSSLPRGAAVDSEVLASSARESDAFQLVEVTRDSSASLAQWPRTSDHATYHWLETSRGPSSSLIQTGDLIDLTIWDNQENSLITGTSESMITLPQMRVSATGTVFVPYVDEVVVQGLTPAQARSEVQSQLGSIAPDAQVQLAVTSGVQNSVAFVAGVGSPGTYPLPDRNTTILSGLAMAGGVNTSLRNPSVSLVRGQSTYRIPATELYAAARNNTRLRGGDKVIVQEDERSFTALGASGVEDIVYFPKESLTALEAISLMGGLNERRADPQGILILREFSASQINTTTTGPTHGDVVFAIDLTSADGLFAARKFGVYPGDTVLATESPVNGLSTVLQLIGQAFGLTTSITAFAE